MLKRAGRELVLRCFELLETHNVRLGLAEPAQKDRQTAVHAVHVERGNPHKRALVMTRSGRAGWILGVTELRLHAREELASFGSGSPHVARGIPVRPSKAFAAGASL